MLKSKRVAKFVHYHCQQIDVPVSFAVNGCEQLCASDKLTQLLVVPMRRINEPAEALRIHVDPDRVTSRKP